MKSNRYARTLAAAVEPLLAHADVTVTANVYWPGQVIWRHAAGGGGVIDLFHINRRPVDNRRTVTDADCDRLVELITADASSHASSPRWTGEAKVKAIAARNALLAEEVVER